MAVTRIKNNQITDASAGNTELGINANTKIQNYSVTSQKIANNLTYGSDLVITGNLTVNGTTTAIDSTYITIEDPIILLASMQTGTPSVDIGFIGDRGDLSNIAFVWNEANSEFITAFTSTGESNTTISISSYASLRTGNATVGNLSVIGNITGDPTFSGNLSAGNLLTSGQISATGTVTGGNVLTDGIVSATGTVTGGNVATAGSVTATGDITGGNVYTAGVVSATGNITGNYFIGNGSQLTGVSADSVDAGNLTGNTLSSNVTFSSLTTVGTLVDLSVTGTTTTGNVSTTGFVSAIGDVTGGNVATAGTVSATGTVTGGNIATGGTVSATGDVTGGNLATAGSVTATGNITGGNVLTSGSITATGNITGADITGSNVYTSGVLSATGTGTFGNVLTGGIVSATGTIQGGNIITAGDVSATGSLTGGNVFTGGQVSAVSTITGGNLATAGTVSATGTVTGGNVVTGGFVSATGDVTGGNLTTGGSVSATGDVTGGNVNTAGTVSATGTGTFGNVATAGTVSATGDVTGGNINTAGSVSATGTGTFGNIATGGSITATGNITGDYFFGDGSQLTGIDTNLIKNGDSNVRILTANGNISMDVSGTSNVVVVTTAGIETSNVSASGNVTGANLLTIGDVSAAGNVTANNVNTTTVTSTGNLKLEATGNIDADNNYINNVLDPLQNQDAATKYYVDQLVATGLTYHDAVVVATTSDLATTTVGTVTYDNGVDGVGATLTTTGSFDLIDSANVQSVGTRILVKNEANAAHNGVYTWSNATVIVRSTDADEYGLDSANAISLNSYFFVTGGDLNLGSAWVVDAPTGTITFGTSDILFAQFSQAQVYSANVQAGISLVGQTFSAKIDNNTTAFDLGGNIIVKAGANLTTPNIGAATGTSLSVTGDVTGGNVYTAGVISATGNITGNYFIGDGSQLTNVSATSVNAANLTGNTLSSNVTFSSLTSVGTLSNLSVTGDTTSGNLLTGGVVSATGTVTGGNIATAGTVSATGDVTGGNLTTAGSVTATGTVTGGNLATAGSVTATGDITGGNVYTAGVVSATGTGTFGNVATAGTVSATGTVQGGNVLTAGEVSAGGSLTGGNIFTGGTISAVSTITGGNIATAGEVTATGTVTGGNIATAGTVSATGTATLGNVLTGGLISATGTITSADTITGGNLATAGSVSATGDVVGGNVSTAGNVTGGNILFGSGIVSGTGDIYAGNIFGNITGNIDAAGNNTEVQFNDSGILGASAGFTFNTTGNVLTVNGNVDGANFLTTGIVSATGNITGNYFIGNGSQLTGIDATSIQNGNSNVQVYANGNVATSVAGTANVVVTTDSGIDITGTVSASGNITGNNVLTGGVISATGTGTFGNIQVGPDSINDIGTDQTITINSLSSNTNFAVNGTGSNVFFVDASTNTASFGNSTQTTNVIVAFNSTDSIKIPVGNTVQKPSVGVTGMIRFNTTLNKVEVYDNSQWTTVGDTVFTVIADQQFNGDGSTVAFTLSSTQTTNSCIVSINGVVQIPTIAYSVSGVDPTCVLTFTEAPAPGDLIDVRQITTTTTITGITNQPGNASVTVSDTSSTVLVTGDLSVTGNVNISGNVATNQINNGTSAVQIPTSGGNVNIDVGSADDMAVFTSTGLFITGEISATGNVTALDFNSLSDQTLKANIVTINNAGQIIDSLTGVGYDWVDGTGHAYGMIAQRVEEVLPEAVSTDANGIKSVKYQMVIPFLIETVKQLRQDIAEIKAQLKK